MKDRVQAEGINVQHCPTVEMLADFLMKPLQGGLFRKFRDVLLGYQHVSSLQVHNNDVVSPEERVGEGDQERDKRRRTKTEQEKNDRECTVQVNTTPITCCTGGDKENNWVPVTPKRAQKYHSTYVKNNSGTSSSRRAT
jgi:hypothetical protein